MKTFLLVIALAALFVLGPVLAMRPSPRLAQLARLRRRAIAAGMRVRVTGASTRAGTVDYVLPWRAGDLQKVRGLHLVAHRDGGEARDCDARDAMPALALQTTLGALPRGVAALRCVDEGLAAEWNEKGLDDDVDRIAGALLNLREAMTAASGMGTSTPNAPDIRT